MVNAKLKLLKILEILWSTDEEHPLTAVQIGKKLKLYGIEAERKSICRDINILKDDAGYDIALSEDNRQGYYMVSRDFEDWELKILIDAVWSAKFLTDDSADKLSKKLYKLASTSSQKMLVSVTPAKLKIKSSNVSTKINIDLILKAVKANRKIKFQYSYTDTELKVQLRRDGFFYIVNPYVLIWQNEHYYLIANYDKYDDLSYYRMDRIKALSLCDEKRKQAEEILGENADIKIEEYVRSSLYHYGGKKIKLTMQVADYMVDDVADYFGTELNFKNAGDKYQVTVNVMDGEGLYYWLLQYGRNIKIISPASVRERFLEKVREILELYKEEIESPKCEGS
ncbi:helix-turn-helix transcriptional regulator [Clostridium luticellarii]|uniref:Uncharacterized protein n=1 Tax=Clostridium luticellarii TaxID=1691940 RepID=A0A2T0B811_9CLOT|nr:WYL domain-containing protein [Clostridium luticellarii]PRR79963.1 hypothetical protein CLLU_34030 [Clostridium luticellarii]